MAASVALGGESQTPTTMEAPMKRVILTIRGTRIPVIAANWWVDTAPKRQPATAIRGRRS